MGTGEFAAGAWAVFALILCGGCSNRVKPVLRGGTAPPLTLTQAPQERTETLAARHPPLLMYAMVDAVKEATLGDAGWYSDSLYSLRGSVQQVTLLDALRGGVSAVISFDRAGRMTEFLNVRGEVLPGSHDLRLYPHRYALTYSDDGRTMDIERYWSYPIPPYEWSMTGRTRYAISRDGHSAEVSFFSRGGKQYSRQTITFDPVTRTLTDDWSDECKQFMRAHGPQPTPPMVMRLSPANLPIERGDAKLILGQEWDSSGNIVRTFAKEDGKTESDEGGVDYKFDPRGNWIERQPYRLVTEYGTVHRENGIPSRRTIRYW